jgi:transposase
MATLFGMFPFLKTLFADSGYQGPKFAKALAKVLPHLDIEIVKRSDQVSGFVVLPKRWIVERTIAWLNRCRRLSKDWGCLNRKALAFLRLASIRLMLRKNSAIRPEVSGRTLRVPGPHEQYDIFDASLAGSAIILTSYQDQAIAILILTS